MRLETRQKIVWTVRICSLRCSLSSFPRKPFILFKHNTPTPAHQHGTLQLVHCCAVFPHGKDHFLTKAAWPAAHPFGVSLQSAFLVPFHQVLVFQPATTTPVFYKIQQNIAAQPSRHIGEESKERKKQAEKWCLQWVIHRHTVWCPDLPKKQHGVENWQCFH